ncbi:ribokinase [Vulcaniibacterium gelatinicum]|uniref:ribokinase n=1 Tax=Vulcaniibacterium gelatinicum TaxID=2598725 RepID=UPI0011CACA7D|nr:ribokinase [Vulcaniibacterium gelatinicum]
MSQASVTVVGSFNVDHVWRCARLPRPGETLGGRYLSGPGGKGFNQAMASARAGAATRFVCALGEDAGGQLARALAAAEGIELHETRSSEPTGTAGIFVDAQGRNSIVIGPGANAALTPADIEAEREALVHAAVVLAQLETPLPAVEHALRLAGAAGACTLLNPAPADVALPQALLALVRIATPNETEFCAWAQRQTGSAPDPDALAALADAALHALCRRLLPQGTVVVTLGAAGCFVSHADHARHGDALPCYRVPAAPAQAVDTTGAGDAFNGALAASLALEPQAPFAQHVRFASRYAALSVERHGAALAMPRRAEVDARFGP